MKKFTAFLFLILFTHLAHCQKLDSDKFKNKSANNTIQNHRIYKPVIELTGQSKDHANELIWRNNMIQIDTYFVFGKTNGLWIKLDSFKGKVNLPDKGFYLDKNTVSGIKNQYFIEGISSNGKSYFSDTLSLTPTEATVWHKPDSAQMMNSRITAAGDELKIQARHFYTGFCMEIGGGAIIELSTLIFKPIPTTTTTNYYYPVTTTTYSTNPAMIVFVVAGALVSIAGTIEIIESFSHINKAGNYLKFGTKNEFSFGTTNSNGIGLTFNY